MSTDSFGFVKKDNSFSSAAISRIASSNINNVRVVPTVVLDIVSTSGNTIGQMAVTNDTINVSISGLLYNNTPGASPLPAGTVFASVPAFYATQQIRMNLVVQSPEINAPYASIKKSPILTASPVPPSTSVASMVINPDGKIHLENVALVGGDIGTGYGTQRVSRANINSIKDIKSYVRCYKLCRSQGGSIIECATGYCVEELREHKPLPHF